MPFDIESFKQSSKKLDLSDIDWDEVPRHPLPRGAIDSMLYMMDIETHTAIYLSELLVSKACMEPEITTFLSCWGYEEMYHGDAFVKFLRAYGVPIPDERPKEIRLKEGFDRVSATMAIMFGSYIFPFFPALYLTVGAVNEMTTLTAYQQLLKRTDHPVLKTMVSRIIKQERVHFAFYRSQAERYLRASAAARGVTRWFMTKRFVIVGEGVKKEADVNQLGLFLFDGDDGLEAAREIDHAARTLPGLQGLSLLERVLLQVRARTAGVPQPDWQAPVAPGSEAARRILQPVG